jgi:hypothetical protein
MFLLSSLFVLPGTLKYSQPNPFASFGVELNTSGSVNVRWQMATETRNVRFEVERSADNKLWMTIEKIPPQLTSQYTYLDGLPLKAVNYYRIKLIKENGYCEYSEVKSIEIANETDCYLWPQPASGILHVRLSFSYGTFEFIDASGRTSKKGTITGFQTEVPIDKLPKGIYFARIKHDNQVWIKKFIKQ